MVESPKHVVVKMTNNSLIFSTIVKCVSGRFIFTGVQRYRKGCIQQSENFKKGRTNYTLNTKITLKGTNDYCFVKQYRHDR